MEREELPVVRPAEAVLFMAFSKLVGQLDQLKLISANELADALSEQADAMPPQCRNLLLNLVDAMKPTSSRMRLILGGPEETDE